MDVTPFYDTQKPEQKGWTLNRNALINQCEQHRLLTSLRALPTCLKENKHTVTKLLSHVHQLSLEKQHRWIQSMRRNYPLLSPAETQAFVQGRNTMVELTKYSSQIHEIALRCSIQCFVKIIIVVQVELNGHLHSSGSRSRMLFRCAILRFSTTVTFPHFSLNEGIYSEKKNLHKSIWWMDYLVLFLERTAPRLPSPSHSSPSPPNTSRGGLFWMVRSAP